MTAYRDVAPQPYIGRFAPSPTGPLHAGSLVAALASWLDARCHQGQWLIRIEDIDAPRCVAGIDQLILQQLSACGLRSDQPVVYQSQRTRLYEDALEQLWQAGHLFPCTCTRQTIQRWYQAQGRPHTRHTEWIYPGTCRTAFHPLAPAVVSGAQPFAWRVRVPQDEAGLISWTDRRLGAQQQILSQAVGDFVVRRADGLWAYQLAVVVDDALQAVTHIVRGIDLADNTPRQMWLQRCLGYALPHYLHTPLVLGAKGEKLSKQHGAAALDVHTPIHNLTAAAHTLGLHPNAQSANLGDLLAELVQQWRQAHGGAVVVKPVPTKPQQP